VDVVVSALSLPAEVWINQSPGTNHWIEFKLQGTKSNRDGIGTKIKLVTKSGTQYNHMTTSAGYASSSAGPVHFGLEPASRLTWSKSGGLRESYNKHTTSRPTGSSLCESQPKDIDITIGNCCDSLAPAEGCRRYRCFVVSPAFWCG
jgi:ASPIC and UnbV